MLHHTTVRIYKNEQVYQKYQEAMYLIGTFDIHELSDPSVRIAILDIINQPELEDSVIGLYADILAKCALEGINVPGTLGHWGNVIYYRLSQVLQGLKPYKYNKTLNSPFQYAQGPWYAITLFITMYARDLLVHIHTQTPSMRTPS